MTLEELKAQGYKLHHTALFRGYVSRKVDYIIEKYEGRYGNGYTVKTPNWDSSSYSYISYYVKRA